MLKSQEHMNLARLAKEAIDRDGENPKRLGNLLANLYHALESHIQEAHAADVPTEGVNPQAGSSDEFAKAAKRNSRALAEVKA